MAAKNRRTKRKDSSDSSSSDDDDCEKRLKKLKNTSFVENENKRKLKKLNKKLANLCDSEDDSDSRRKIPLKRPISTISAVNPTKSSKKKDTSTSEDSEPTPPPRTKKPTSTVPVVNPTKSSKKKVTSDSEDSELAPSPPRIKKPTSTVPVVKSAKSNKKKETSNSEDSSLSVRHSKATATTNKQRPAKKKRIDSTESESEDDEKSAGKKKDKDSSREKKSVISRKKTKSHESESDESSGKEFQISKMEKVKRKSGIVGKHVSHDYTILETPTKSDEESILVDNRREISLKNLIIEELDVIQKIASDLREKLEYNGEYVIKKKVTAVRDSKFLAHKVLRQYDETFDKLKKCRDNFCTKYSKWVRTCTKKQSNTSLGDGSLAQSFKKRFDLSSGHSSDSDEKSKSKEKNVSKGNKSLSKKSKESAASDDEFEKKTVAKSKTPAKSTDSRSAEKSDGTSSENDEPRTKKHSGNDTSTESEESTNNKKGKSASEKKRSRKSKSLDNDELAERSGKSCNGDARSSDGAKSDDSNETLHEPDQNAAVQDDVGETQECRNENTDQIERPKSLEKSDGENSAGSEKMDVSEGENEQKKQDADRAEKKSKRKSNDDDDSRSSVKSIGSRNDSNTSPTLTASKSRIPRDEQLSKSNDNASKHAQEEETSAKVSEKGALDQEKDDFGTQIEEEWSTKGAQATVPAEKSKPDDETEGPPPPPPDVANASISECDSDEIFSSNESQTKKVNGHVSSVVKENESLKKANETYANSEELFDSTASEIPNTPIKSPILSSRRTLRKNLLAKTHLVPQVERDKEEEEEPSAPAATIEEKQVENDAEEKDRSRDDENVEVEAGDVERKKGEKEKEETSDKDGSKDESEAEARKKLLCDSSPSSGSEADDSSNDNEDDDGEKNASAGSPDKKLSSSATEQESRARAKRLTKKTKKPPTSTHATKTRNLSPGSSSSSSSLSTSTGDNKKKKEKTKRKKRSLSSDSDGLLPSAKRRQTTSSFDIRQNRHYKADKKLRMDPRVVLERLPKSELLKHAKALAKSKSYLSNKEVNSLTNFDGLEAKKKSKKQLDESADGESVKAKKKSKKEKKPDKSLDEDDNDIEIDQDMVNTSENENEKSCEIPAEQDITDEAEKEAKEALLDSSDDEEAQAAEEAEEDGQSDESDEKPKKAKAKKAKTNNKKASNDDEAKSDENDEEEDKSKGEWKRDKLLTFHVTDTESDEEKAKKAVEKRKAKKDKEAEKKSGDEDKVDGDATDQSPIKQKVSKKGRKQRKTRRIFDSDEEAKIDSSEEDEDEEDGAGKSDDDDGEFEVDKEEEGKKKKSKRRRKKSSDSDTSSSEKRPKTKRKRIKKVASDDSDSDKDSPGKSHRKNIRKVLKDKHVTDDTKKAAQEEEERLKRIAERQKLFNDMYDAKLAGEAKVDKLVLDVDEETKEELVVVDKELVKRLKPHQAQGIKFMWDACFESLKQIEKSEGSGCIIAHCMGLGKTFQVVTLVHTLLSHEETKVRTVMIVCPLSTVLNWVNEFSLWLKHVKNGDEIEIYEMTKTKKNFERKYQLESWQKTGGVLIIGYEMFRNLTSTGKKMRKAMQTSITRSLVDPGADLVVCDEGHLLKNEDSALSKAMKLVKTMRRIVLTGTPLQNNLKEYHCMVQFVKPNLLGTKKEFLNRFVNPITNGQFDDSTEYDVKLMKKRSHVLHKMLEGSVQRFDYSVLTPFLPPKQEYVIYVRLSDVQIKMYQHYLDNFARRFGGRNGSLFADFQELQRIWTHPLVLRFNAVKVDKRLEKKRLEASDSEGSLKDFIDDDEESDSESPVSSSGSGSGSDVQCMDSDSEKRPVKMTRAARMNLKEELQEEVPVVQATYEETAWWSKMLEEKHYEDMRLSTKLLLLFSILEESQQIGDKVLVFSQSLYSLSLIEHFLRKIDQETQNDGEKSEYLEGHSSAWVLGSDYFRLDGSTSAENRSSWCKTFNDPKNTRARLFLISTKAGGLGINLTGANRVIVMDASFNPTYDSQAIYRVYRFGQKKPCYIYRFIAAGTMEEKIYNRQVTKLSLACRVVDEQQIERHYTNHDLTELYQFDTYEDQQITLALPKDRLLAEIFSRYKDRVYKFHEHDSLLENKEEEELDEEERKQAWLEYEEEKQGKRQMVNMGMGMGMGMGNNFGFNQMLMNMQNFPELESIKLLIQKDYPNLPPEHLDSVARQAVFDMYRFVDQQAINPLNQFNAGHMQGNMYGNHGMPAMTQQQQTINQQNQLMNLLNQPQMNYQGVNHMPAYSGRGRPPKHLSNQMYNPMRQMPMQAPMMQAPMMQASMQPQQSMMNAQANDEIEVLTEKRVAPPNNDVASTISNQPEE